MICEICNVEKDGLKGLSLHLNKKHDINIKEYYDKYLKKENDGICYFCGKPSIFLNLTKGYHMMKTRTLERGEKIKNGLQKSFLKNENFFKEKSRQSIKFWLKRGYNEEESLKIVKNIQKDIFEKTAEKRKNKDNYKDVNNNQIGYWLKRGFTEDNAKKKISERQKTFSLEKCIEKHGEVEGLKIWNERQKKME